MCVRVHALLLLVVVVSNRVVCVVGCVLLVFRVGFLWFGSCLRFVIASVCVYVWFCALFVGDCVLQIGRILQFIWCRFHGLLELSEGSLIWRTR